MPRKREPVSVQARDDNLLSQPDSDADFVDRIADLFDSAPGSVRARVFKIADNGSEAHAFDISPDDIDGIYDRAREETGAGKYQVTVYEKGKYRGRWSFAVLAKPSKPAAAGPDPTLMAVLERMERSNNEFKALIAGMVARQGPAAAAPSMLEQVQTLQALKNLTSEGTGKTSVDLILEGLRLGKEIQGGGDSGDLLSTIGGILKSAMESPTVGKLVEGVLANQSQPGATAPAVPGKPGALPVPVTLTAPGQPAQPQSAHPLAGHLGLLVDAAVRGSPWEIYANVTADALPDAALDMLLDNPNALAALEQIEPRIGAHRAWFVSLLDGVRHIVASDDSPVDEGEPLAGGNSEAPIPS